MKLFKKFKKGFTLVELVVVIAIIAILSGVSVAVYIGVTNNAKESKYLQLAKQGMTQLLTEYDGNLEENTIFSVKDGDKEVAFYKYNQGKIAKCDGLPANDVDYMYPTNSSNSTILEEVTAYRPIVKAVVSKVNSSLINPSETNRLSLADACLNLTKQDFSVMNYRDSGYKFAYALSCNKIFIVDTSAADILYTTSSISSVPTDKELLTGVAIETADDLIEFSRASNLHQNGIPTEANIFVKNSPTVICNINKDITFDDATNFIPISNWYIYGGNNGSIYYDIRILLSGKNHSINNITYDSLIGGARPGSIFRDLKISYKLGESEINPTNLGNTISTINSLYDGHGYWHTGLFIKYIDTRVSTQLTLLENIDLCGQVHIGGATQSGANTLGLCIGYFNNKNSSTIMLKATNVNIFNHTGDVLTAVRNGSGALKDGFGAFTGMVSFGSGSGVTKVALGVELVNVVHATITPYGRSSGGTNTNPTFGNFEGF